MREFLDSAKLAVREKGPKWACFTHPQKCSMTCIDKNGGKTSSRVGETRQQKGTPYGVPFEMVDRTGLEPVTSCV